MKKHFSKSAYWKRLLALFLFAALLVSMLAGCSSEGGGSKSNGYYGRSEKAVAALEDAIWILDRCLDEKMSPDECAEELEAVVKQYEKHSSSDDILKNALLSISIYSGSISTAALRNRIGSVSGAEVARKVREARADLAEKLK